MNISKVMSALGFGNSHYHSQKNNLYNMTKELLKEVK